MQKLLWEYNWVKIPMILCVFYNKNICRACFFSMKECYWKLQQNMLLCNTLCFKFVFLCGSFNGQCKWICSSKCQCPELIYSSGFWDQFLFQFSKTVANFTYNNNCKYDNQHYFTKTSFGIRLRKKLNNSLCFLLQKYMQGCCNDGLTAFQWKSAIKNSWSYHFAMRFATVWPFSAAASTVCGALSESCSTVPQLLSWLSRRTS